MTRGTQKILLVVVSVVAARAAGCHSTSGRTDPRGPEASPAASPATAASADRQQEPPSTRRSVFRPQVAGPAGRGFYDSRAETLRSEVDGYLAAAAGSEDLAGRDVVGLLSPHAGYRYSGPAAAHAYRQLQGRRYETVVLLALSHRQEARKVALLDYDAYETPLGEIPIDRELVARLIAEAPDLVEANDRVFRGEHSLEVQLPMLQRALERTPAIVPIILATHDEAHCERLARLLREQLGDRGDVLFVASSDLSHFFDYDRASEIDRETLALVTGLRIDELRARGPRQREMPCGYYPLLTLMHLTSLYADASPRATLLRYENSGDTAGDRSRVVGYGAVAFSLEAGARPESAGAATAHEPIAREHRAALMSLARRSVEAAVRGEELRAPRPPSGPLADPGAAFVTLNCETDASGRCVGRGDSLRGCIGHVVARVPLHDCVADVARSAAIHDRRFPPITEAELRYLSFEVSVLTPPEPVEDPSTVVVGRDGLIMSRGPRRGLLLPQVPVEWGWDRNEFLARTCRKAGLELSCWQNPQTRIERFGAIVWGEDLRVEEHR